jgi:O-antigen/teichoic acid export membrane protein
MDQESSPIDAQAETPDATNLNDLKNRARRGVVLLAVRTVAVQLIVLGGQIVLARLLEPKDFGVFAIVQFALNFFAFFGDAGLGGGLIQKKLVPTERELSSVFWAQILISVAVICAVALFSRAISIIWPDLPAGAVWILRALSLSLLLTSIRTVPAILMERELQFGRLGALDLALSASFYVTAAVFAWGGYGVWALTLAVLMQGFVGAVLAYAFRPFRPRAALDRELLRPIFRFGVPFQLNRVVGFLNSAVTPIYAGSVLGAKPVGLVNWAQNTAYFPLKLVEIVGRVTFPLYSRLQDDRPLLGESLGRSIQLCAAFTSFFVALFAGMGTQVIQVIYGDKWLPALPLLYVYAAAISVGFVTPLVATALEATGRPKLVLWLAIFTTLLNWLIVPIVTARWGMLGFSLGYSVHVVVGNTLLLVLLSRLIPHARLLRRTWSPILAGLLVYLIARYGLASLADGVLGFIGVVLVLLLVHLGVLFAADNRGIREALLIVPGASRFTHT